MLQQAEFHVPIVKNVIRKTHVQRGVIHVSQRVKQEMQIKDLGKTLAVDSLDSNAWMGPSSCWIPQTW